VAQLDGQPELSEYRDALIKGFRGQARRSESRAAGYAHLGRHQFQYAFGWRRLAWLFSIRAYRHVSRPVEINPWLDRTGRGTFPNTVRQVQRAIEFAQAPQLAHLDGGFGVLIDNRAFEIAVTIGIIEVIGRCR
jgi:hypothetical protein